MARRRCRARRGCPAADHVHLRQQGRTDEILEGRLVQPRVQIVLVRPSEVALRVIKPLDREFEGATRRTLESIVEKGSSRGGTQFFVTSVARYRDAIGEIVAVNRETVVYQPLA